MRSADYPQEAKFIRAIFQPLIQASNTTPQGNITLSLPGDVGKVAEAKTGRTKLLLFHITADINFDAGTFSNLQQAVPSAGMAVILAMPRAARAQAYSCLLRKSCLSASMQDPFSIRSSQMSLKIVQKTIASNLLGGNFATQHATSMHNEVNAVDHQHFYHRWTRQW